MSALNFITSPADYNTLKEILEILNAQNFFWIIGDSDIISENRSENILTRGEYSGSDVLDILNQKVFYVFSELVAFKTSGNLIPTTYNDYLNSDCEIAIFVVDCIGYSIYVKDKNLFHTLQLSLSKKECKRYKVLSNEEELNFHFSI